MDYLTPDNFKDMMVQHWGNMKIVEPLFTKDYLMEASVETIAAHAESAYLEAMYADDDYLSEAGGEAGDGDAESVYLEAMYADFVRG